MIRRCIGVIGTGEAHNITPEQQSLAIQVGELIARRGWTLVVGTGSGVSDFAAHAASAFGGLVIGISPAGSREEHCQTGLSLDNYDVILFTGFGFRGRNVLLVRTADALIAIGGAFGTLNEISIALAEYKPIALLANSGGITDVLLGIESIKAMPKTCLFHAKTANEAVAFVGELISLDTPTPPQ